MRTSANKKDKSRCRLPSWRLHEKYLKMALFIEKNRKKMANIIQEDIRYKNKQYLFYQRKSYSPLL